MASPGALSEGLFAVSPSSAGGVAQPTAGDAALQPNSAVFFEDPAVGWGVGTVLGYTADGRLVLKDPLQAEEVVCAPSVHVVPVPPAFSKLAPQDFEELRSLADLPPLPAAAREPAALVALLQRMHKTQWDVAVTANPPLVLSFPRGVMDRDRAEAGQDPEAAEKKDGEGGPAPPPTLHPPLSDLAAKVCHFESDRCLLLLPTASQISIPTAGRLPFQYVQHFLSCTNPGAKAPPRKTPVVALNVGEGLTYPSRDRVRARCLAVCTLIESLTCYSAPGRPSVSGMCYTVEMVHCERDDGLDGVKVTPIAVDHTLVSYLLPHPPLQADVDVIRSPYLAFFQLAESPILPELGLPPASTLMALMPRSHFDVAAPSFADAKGALELLGIGGAMGVQLWGVLGAITHLLLARYLLQTSEGRPPANEPPPGLLTPDEHIAWASKCLQVPSEYVRALVVRPTPEENLAPRLADAALASLACHLYERLVQFTFSCVNDDPHFPESTGYSTFLVSLLPFESYRDVRRGYPCRRLEDRRYMVGAVKAFYARHAPERVAQAEYLVNACVARGEMERFVASLEAKHARPRWFSTRERMWDLYEVHRPQLLATVDDILLHYHGREDELFEALETKYGFAASTKPPLIEQLEAFFNRFDKARLAEVPALARKWGDLRDELEAQLSEQYQTSFLEHRRQAYALYSKYSPNHLALLDDVLAAPQFAGPNGPAELVASLRAKYERQDFARQGTYADMFRLVQNSMFEVFHLLYMHHFYPTSETIRTRQRLVDMLISTAAPSIVASALDSLTASPHPVSGARLCDEIVTRFGGGASPAVSSEGDRLTIEHSLEPCSYSFTDVWAMNADPISESYLGHSGNAMVRGLASGLVRSGTTYISRCVTALTSVMATLATVDSPTSWVLVADSHYRHADQQLHIPTVLQQLRGFYVDLIAGEAALQPKPPPPPRVTAKELQERSDRLATPLPSSHTTPSLIPAIDPSADAEAQARLGLPPAPMAWVAAVRQLEQEQWVFRQQLHEQAVFYRSLLELDHEEELGRLRAEVEQHKKRVTIVGALRMRATYTLLAEGILSIEKREKACRDRMHGFFRARCGLFKLQYLERRCRKDLAKTEHTERVGIAHLTGTISAATLRKDIRESHQQHFKPKAQPQRDVRRFLELLEEKEKLCGQRPAPMESLAPRGERSVRPGHEQEQESIVKELQELEIRDRANESIITQQQVEIDELKRQLEDASRIAPRPPSGASSQQPASSTAPGANAPSPQRELIDRAASALQQPLLRAHSVQLAQAMMLDPPPMQATRSSQWAPPTAEVGVGMDLYQHLKGRALSTASVHATQPHPAEPSPRVERDVIDSSGAKNRNVSPRRLSKPQLPVTTPALPAEDAPSRGTSVAGSAYGSLPPSPELRHVAPPRSGAAGYYREPSAREFGARPRSMVEPDVPQSLPLAYQREPSEVDRSAMSDCESLAKELEDATVFSAAAVAAARQAIDESEGLVDAKPHPLMPRVFNANRTASPRGVATPRGSRAAAEPQTRPAPQQQQQQQQHLSGSFSGSSYVPSGGPSFAHLPHGASERHRDASADGTPVMSQPRTDPQSAQQRQLPQDRSVSSAQGDGGTTNAPMPHAPGLGNIVQHQIDIIRERSQRAVPDVLSTDGDSVNVAARTLPGSRPGSFHGAAAAQEQQRGGSSLEVLNLLSSFASAGSLGRLRSSPQATFGDLSSGGERSQVLRDPDAASVPSRVTTPRGAGQPQPPPADLTPAALRAWADYLEGKPGGDSRVQPAGAGTPRTPRTPGAHPAHARVGMQVRGGRPSPRAAGRSRSPGGGSRRTSSAKASNGSTWMKDRFDTPPARQAFLHKGEGVLSSAGVHATAKAKNHIRGYSPHKGSLQTVKGRIPPATVNDADMRRRAQGKHPFVRPQVQERHGTAEGEADRVNESFDQVKALVLRLFDIQQQMQDPRNADPDVQQELSEQALRVRQTLAEHQQ